MELTARVATLKLAETFVISRESSDEDDVVHVEVRHGELSGFGEGARRLERDALRAAAGIGEIGDDHDPHARPDLHRTRLHEPR